MIMQSENLLVFQAFTRESLWGNIGGYVGMFLGVSFMQVPQIFLKLLVKLKSYIE